MEAKIKDEIGDNSPSEVNSIMNCGPIHEIHIPVDCRINFGQC